jgi:hypothetical protein
MHRLVGKHNTSFPNAHDLASEWNDWIQRRLIVLDDVPSHKAYEVAEQLKSPQTEDFIGIRKRHTDQYDIRNFTFIVFSNNDMTAVKVEQEDRRWFFPTVSEEKAKEEFWVEINSHFNQIDLGKLLWWAQNYEKLGLGKYFQTGEEAPMTTRKVEIMGMSLSRSQQEAAAIARYMNEPDTEPMSICDNTIRMVVIELMKEKEQKTDMISKPMDLRKVMCRLGCIAVAGQIRYKKYDQYFLLSAKLNDKINAEWEASGMTKEEYTVIKAKENEGIGKLSAWVADERIF